MCRTTALGLLTCAASALVVLLLVSTASAQSPAQVRRAQTLFDRGIAHSDAGRLTEALSAFEASSRNVPRASTSYNIGLMLFRLGRFEDSLQALDDALALEHTEDDASRIASLRAEIQAVLSGHPSVPHTQIVAEPGTDSAASPPPEAPIDAPPEPSTAPPDEVGATPASTSRSLVAPYTLLVSGAVLTASGGLIAGLGIHDARAVQGAPLRSEWDAYEERHARAPRRIAIGGTLAGVGLGVVVSSLVWARGSDAPAHASACVVDVAPGGAVATCTGTF